MAEGKIYYSCCSLREDRVDWEIIPFERLYANVCHSKTPLRLLTKGDNNAADDTELYAVGQSFLNRKEDVIGSVAGFIPYVGYVTILLSEYPWLKQAMLGIMGLMVVLQRE